MGTTESEVRRAIRRMREEEERRQGTQDTSRSITRSRLRDVIQQARGGGPPQVIQRPERPPPVPRPAPPTFVPPAAGEEPAPPPAGQGRRRTPADDASLAQTLEGMPATDELREQTQNYLRQLALGEAAGAGVEPPFPSTEEPEPVAAAEPEPVAPPQPAPGTPSEDLAEDGRVDLGTPAFTQALGQAKEGMGPTGPTHLEGATAEERQVAQERAEERQTRFTEQLRLEDYRSNLSVGERFEEASLSFARGGGNMLAGMPTAIAVLAKQLDEMTWNQYEGKTSEELFLGQVGKVIRDFTKEHFAGDPELQKSFLDSVLPAAFGSAAVFLTGGLAGRGLSWVRGLTPAQAKATSLVTTMTMGGTAESGGQYYEARQHGASEEEARKVGLLAAPAGWLEALPVEMQLNRLFSGGTRAVVRESFSGGLEEGLQETVQGIWGNFLARRYYDPERNLLDDVGTSALAGLITGGVMSAGMTVGGNYFMGTEEALEKAENEYLRYYNELNDKYDGELKNMSGGESRALGRLASKVATLHGVNAADQQQVRPENIPESNPFYDAVEEQVAQGIQEIQERVAAGENYDAVVQEILERTGHDLGRADATDTGTQTVDIGPTATEAGEVVEETETAPEPVTEEATAEEAEEEQRPGFRRRVADLIDPTRREEAEELEEQRDLARRQAETDEDTGLGNKRAFNRARESVDTDPEWEWVAIDADGLKGVNEVLGHDEGDALIQRIGEVIGNVADRGFRRSGDEFFIAVPTGQGHAVGREVQDLVGRIPIGETGLEAGVSYGVGPTSAQADEALGEVKDQRRAGGLSYRDISGETTPTEAPQEAAEAPETGTAAVQEEAVEEEIGEAEGATERVVPETAEEQEAAWGVAMPSLPAARNDNNFRVYRNLLDSGFDLNPSAVQDRIDDLGIPARAWESPEGTLDLVPADQPAPSEDHVSRGVLFPFADRETPAAEVERADQLQAVRDEMRRQREDEDLDLEGTRHRESFLEGGYAGVDQIPFDEAFEAYADMKVRNYQNEKRRATEKQKVLEQEEEQFRAGYEYGRTLTEAEAGTEVEVEAPTAGPAGTEADVATEEQGTSPPAEAAPVPPIVAAAAENSDRVASTLARGAWLYVPEQEETAPVDAPEGTREEFRVLPSDLDQAIPTDNGRYIYRRDLAELDDNGVPQPVEGQATLPEEGEEGILYRGMSAEEYQAFVESGEISSAGTYNIGEEQEGTTSWATDPRTAQSYANGFAPQGFKPTFTRPAYVVAITRPGDADIRPVPGTDPEQEVSVTRPITSEEVVGVWQGDVYAVSPGSVTMTVENGQWRPGSRSDASAYVTWSDLGVQEAATPTAEAEVEVRKAPSYDETGQWDVQIGDDVYTIHYEQSHNVVGPPRIWVLDEVNGTPLQEEAFVRRLRGDNKQENIDYLVQRETDPERHALTMESLEGAVRQSVRPEGEVDVEVTPAGLTEEGEVVFYRPDDNTFRVGEVTGSKTSASQVEFFEVGQDPDAFNEAQQEARQDWVLSGALDLQEIQQTRLKESISGFFQGRPEAAPPVETGLPSRAEAQEVALSIWQRPEQGYLRDRFLDGFDAAVEGRPMDRGRRGPTDPWVQGYEFARPEGLTPEEEAAVEALEDLEDMELGEAQAFYGDRLANTVVTDEDGAPLLVYRGEHGGPDAGTGIQTRRGSITFTPEIATAVGYAEDPNNRRDTPVAPRVIPAFLDIRKPVVNNEEFPDDPYIDLGVLRQILPAEEMDYILDEYGDSWVKNTSRWEEVLDETGEENLHILSEEALDLFDTLPVQAYVIFDDARLVEAFRAQGYDGAIHGGAGMNGGEVEYRVFNESQIVSPWGFRRPGRPQVQEDLFAVGEEEAIYSPAAPGVPTLDGVLAQWTTGHTRPGTGRFRIVRDWAMLSEAERTSVTQAVNRALVDEAGNDRIAGIVNGILGTQVMVRQEGVGVNPVINPSNPQVFSRLPSDPVQARAWIQRYMAIRGILLGQEHQASFRAVAEGHGQGELDGYFIDMDLTTFNEVALKVDGGTYDAETGTAVFVNFLEESLDDYTENLATAIGSPEVTMAAASFEGDFYGPSEYYATIGRDHGTLRQVAGIISQHLRPAVAASIGVSEGSVQVDRLTRVSVGLRALARAYQFPPPAGVTSGIEVEEANERLAKRWKSVSRMGFDSKVDAVYRRFWRTMQDVIPALRSDLGLTEEQVNDWYAQAGKDQRAIMTLIQPELANDADYVIATAIHSVLSNGNEVNNETEIGTHVVEQFLLTGEISVVNPTSAIRGTWYGRRGEGKEGTARFVVGQSGEGVGGDAIPLSSRWLTHEMSMRRLQTLVANLGKKEAAEWLRNTHIIGGRWNADTQEQEIGDNGRIAYNAVELLGPKIGQYLLDKLGVENQGSTIDQWIGRLADILIGKGTISESVTDEDRAVMQEVFRRYSEDVGGTTPAAVQAITWYVTKYLYRMEGTQEKSTAYATLPSSMADFLAGRTRRKTEKGVRYVVGQPKDHDTVEVHPSVGWERDDTYDKIANRMNTRAARRGDPQIWGQLVDSPSILGLDPQVARDLAQDAIAGAEVLSAIEEAEGNAVVAEAVKAYGNDTRLVNFVRDKINEDLGIQAPEERIARIEDLLEQNDRGHVNILGERVNGPATLSRLLRPFREPRYEISHWLLLDDRGNVVFHAQSTAGVLGYSLFDKKTFAQVVQAADRLGSTRLVLAHNHPSGDTTPSDMDFTASNYVAEMAAKHGIQVDYHLVINSDEANLLTPKRKPRYGSDGRTVVGESIRFEGQKLDFDPYEEIDWTDAAKGERNLLGVNDVAARIRMAPGPQSVFMVYVDSQLRTIAMEAKKLTDVTGTKVGRWLPARLKDLGAHGVIAVVSDDNTNGAYLQAATSLEDLVDRHNVNVIDVVDMKLNGKARASARSNNLLSIWPARPTSEQMRDMLNTEIVEADPGMVGEQPAQYDPAEVNETQELPDPRKRVIANPESTVMQRVLAALQIEKGDRQYTQTQIKEAIRAAQHPDILSLSLEDFQAPEGRGGYMLERFLRDVRAVSPEHDEEVRSPVEVIQELSDALGVPIVAKGKEWRILQRRGTGGAYRPHTRVIRLNQPGDVETAMHEVGHYVHELVYGLTEKKRLSISDIPNDVRGELMSLAAGVSGEDLGEGVAEFFRRYVTNPDAAAKRAPNYFDHIEETLNERYPEVKEALLKARADFRLWLTASDAARIRSRISSQPEDARHNPNRTRFDEFVDKVVDNTHYVGKVTNQILGDDPDISVSRKVHRMMQISRGAGGTGEFIWKFGTIDWQTKRVNGRGMKEILDPIFEAGQRDDFTAYAVARRAKFLIEERGLEISGLSPSTVNATIEQFGNEVFENAFDELVAYNRRLLEMLVDAGVLSQEDFDRIEEHGGMDVYVPFHRVPEGKAPKGLGGKGDSYLSAKVVKRLRGGGGDIIDPLESMINQTFVFTQAAFRQRVSDALVALSEEEGAGEFLHEVTPQTVVHTAKFQGIWEEVDRETGGALGEIPDEAKEAFAKIYRPGDFFGDNEVIGVMREGERTWYRVTDPDLLAALEGTNESGLNLLSRMAALPSRWRRAGAILSPDFLVRNPFRDQWIAWIQDEYGYAPGVDWVRGIMSLFRNDEMFKLWQAGGGGLSTMVGQDRDSRQAALASLGKKPLSNVVKSPYHMLEALSMWSEYGTRLGVFIKAYKNLAEKQGLSHEEALDRAVLASRNNPVDYALHGSATAVIRATATFWNAGLQGDTRTLKALTGKQKPETLWGKVTGNMSRTSTLKAIMSITVPSVMLALAYRDDDEYWAIPQWQRDFFWMVKIPVDMIPSFMQQTEDSGLVEQWFKPFIASEEGVWLRFPKPFGLGQIFGSIPERAIEWQIQNDPEGIQELVTGFNPLSPWANNPLFGGFPDFAVAQPFFDNFANYSRFLRRPIESASDEQVIEYLRYGEGTSEFSKWATKMFYHLGADEWSEETRSMFGITSPKKFENVFRGWTAGLGGYFLQGTDAIVRLTGDNEIPQPASGPADVPVLKAFIARNPGWGSEPVQDFYRRWNHVQQVYNGLTKLQEDRTVSRVEVNRYRRRNATEIRQYHQMQPVFNMLGEFRGMSQAVARSQQSPTQKASAQHYYGQQAMQAARRIMDRIREDEE